MTQQKKLIVIGGGLCGCMAAIYAKQAGFSPIIIEPRSYLGYEITGRYQTFLPIENLEKFKAENILNLPGIKVDNEYCLYQGEVKTHLLNLLKEAEIPCLFLSRTVGLAMKKAAFGVLLTNTFGIFFLRGDAVIDCSGEDAVLSMLGKNKDAQISRLTIAMELEGFPVSFIDKTITVSAPESVDVEFHHSKRGGNTKIAILSDFADKAPFPFARSIWENQMKQKAIRTLAEIRKGEGFSNVRLLNISTEIGIELNKSEAVLPVDNVLSGVPMLDFGFGTEQILKCQKKIKKFLSSFSVVNVDDNNMNEKYMVNGIGLTATDCQVSENQFYDDGLPVELFPVKINPHVLPQIDTDVLISGMGTAGISTVNALIKENTDFVGVDSQFDFGGTRTCGHVVNYYIGNRTGFTSSLNDAVGDFEENILYTPEQDRISSRLGLLLYWHWIMKEKKKAFLLGTMICDAQITEKSISSVIAANEHGIFCIRPNISVDATGNANLAALAGAQCYFGDPDDGNVQCFSQWGVSEKEQFDFHQRIFVGDYDALDVTCYSDMLRGVYVAHENNSPYYFSHPLSYREGRRIEGEAYLTIEQAIRNNEAAEPLTVAYCGLDNHGRTSADFARLGYGANFLRMGVAIPFRCFIPKGIDKMLVGGKSCSMDRDALGICRMSSDIQNAGYALGIAATMAVTLGIDVKLVPYDILSNKLQSLNLLPEECLETNLPSAVEAIDTLINGKAYGLFNVILQPEDIILPLLIEKFADKNNNKIALINLSKALAWFRDMRGVKYLRERLKWLYKHEIKDSFCDIDPETDSVQHGIHENLNEYWELNQLVELLVRLKDDDSISLLCKIIQNTDAGGSPHVSRIPYYSVRKDMIYIPYYERIYILAYSFMQMPSSLAIKPLEQLLNKPHIGGDYYRKEITGSFPLFFSSYLELTIARALLRCGSEKGREILENYALDARSILANAARRELKNYDMCI